jgi:hypothetical protein
MVTCGCWIVGAIGVTVSGTMIPSKSLLTVGDVAVLSQLPGVSTVFENEEYPI